MDYVPRLPLVFICGLLLSLSLQRLCLKVPSVAEIYLWKCFVLFSEDTTGQGETFFL